MINSKNKLYTLAFFLLLITQSNTSRPMETIKSLCNYVFDYALEKTQNLVLACRFDKTKLAKNLIAQGHPIDKNCLYWACKNNNMELITLLFDKEAPIHEHCIHWACMNNNVDLVRLLIEKGVNLHTLFIPEKWHKNYYGDEKTPLSIAAENGNIEIATLLLEHSADINQKIIHLSSRAPAPDWISSIYFEEETPILVALKNNHTNMADFLLANGANLNPKRTCRSKAYESNEPPTKPRNTKDFSCFTYDLNEDLKKKFANRTSKQHSLLFNMDRFMKKFPKRIAHVRLLCQAEKIDKKALQEAVYKIRSTVSLYLDTILALLTNKETPIYTKIETLERLLKLHHAHNDISIYNLSFLDTQAPLYAILLTLGMTKKYSSHFIDINPIHIYNILLKYDKQDRPLSINQNAFKEIFQSINTREIQQFLTTSGKFPYVTNHLLQMNIADEKIGSSADVKIIELAEKLATHLKITNKKDIDLIATIVKALANNNTPAHAKLIIIDILFSFYGEAGENNNARTNLFKDLFKAMQLKSIVIFLAKSGKFQHIRNFLLEHNLVNQELIWILHDDKEQRNQTFSKNVDRLGVGRFFHKFRETMKIATKCRLQKPYTELNNMRKVYNILTQYPLGKSTTKENLPYLPHELATKIIAYAGVSSFEQE